MSDLQGSLREFFARCDPGKHIVGEERSVEENVKIKIVLPLLQGIGWDLLEDIWFEYKSVDILLRAGGNTVIVETKTWKERLENYESQYIDYALKLRTPWVVACNGTELRLYCVLGDSKSGLFLLEKVGLAEICSTGLPSILGLLAGVIGKDSVLSGCRNLRALAETMLGGKSFDDALAAFFDVAGKPLHRRNQFKMTHEIALAILEKSGSPLAASMKVLLGSVARYVEGNPTLKLMGNTKELNVKFKAGGAVRRDVGLFGLKPMECGFSWSPENFSRLGLERDMLNRGLALPRRMKAAKDPGQWVEDVFSWFSSACDMISAQK